MHSIVKTLLTGLAILVAISPAGRAGDISISVLTIAEQSGFGYTLGQSYSFTLSLTGNFQSSNSTYSAFAMAWTDTGLGTTRLWSTLEGAFANGGGTFTTASPSSYFDIDPGDLEFSAYGLGSSIGVETPNGTAVSMIYGFLSTSSYPPSPTAITPEDYFSGFPNPSFDLGGSTWEIDMVGGQTIDFNVTAVSVVPEPATWTLLAASLGGGLLLLRRRKVSV